MLKLLVKISQHVSTLPPLRMKQVIESPCPADPSSCHGSTKGAHQCQLRYTASKCFCLCCIKTNLLNPLSHQAPPLLPIPFHTVMPWGLYLLFVPHMTFCGRWLSISVMFYITGSVMSAISTILREWKKSFLNTLCLKSFLEQFWSYPLNCWLQS